MKTKINYLMLCAMCLVMATSAYAQKKNKNNSVDVAGNNAGGAMDAKAARKYYNVDVKKYLQDWNVYIHFGTTTPFTDIRSYDWVRQTKKPSELQWGAGFGLTRMFNSAFGLNVDYTLGRLLGRTVSQGGFAENRQYWKQLFPERTQADGPVYFKTNIFHQAALNLYIDWMGMGMSYNKFIRSQITGKPVKGRRVAIYTKLGVGLIRVSSQIYNVKDDKPIANNVYLRGFTNKFTEVVFPLAMGIKFKVTKLIDIGLEGTFTFTNSDKLDAMNFVSRIDPATGGSINSLSKMNRDAYAYINAQVCFKFGRIGSQKEHIEWVNPLAFIMANTKPQEVNLKDSDNDGVLDILDEEPSTPAGYKVDTHGVTLDSDHDGCPDTTDPEPFSTPAYPIVDCKNVIDTTKVEMPAMPEMRKTPPFDPEALVKKVQKVEDNQWKMTSIYFALDKYNITTSAASELQKVGLIMSTNPDMVVNVKGNCDSRASAEYNQKLSENRVNAAIRYLNTHFGIAQDRFIKLPMGKSDPLVKDANNEDQHMVNRRVDFSPAK